MSEYRVIRFSQVSLEQREFNKRTKTKRKLDRATLNAEMHANKAAKADAKATKLMETSKDSKKALSLISKSDKAKKSVVNDTKRIRDLSKSLSKLSPKSTKLDETKGILSKVEKTAANSSEKKIAKGLLRNKKALAIAGLAGLGIAGAAALKNKK